MKYFKCFAIANFALFITLLSSCGPEPEWKQKGFKSENEYLLYQQKENWRNSDSKFIGTWTYTKYGVLNTQQHFRLEIMEDGFGKFKETQNPGYFNQDASFRWKKINDTTIEVYNLFGQFDPYDGSYRFRRFNGNYSIEYNNSKCLKLRTDYEFCK